MLGGHQTKEIGHTGALSLHNYQAWTLSLCHAKIPANNLKCGKLHSAWSRFSESLERAGEGERDSAVLGTLVIIAMPCV